MLGGSVCGCSIDYSTACKLSSVAELKSWILDLSSVRVLGGESDWERLEIKFAVSLVYAAHL